MLWWGEIQSWSILNYYLKESLNLLRGALGSFLLVTETLCISFSETVLNEPKVTPFTRRPLFPFAQRGTSRLWHEDRKPPVSWVSRQESPVSSLSAAWMYLFHSFAACSSGYTGKAMLGMIISGEVFVYFFFNKNKLFCFYSTCLNGRTTNNLGS